MVKEELVEGLKTAMIRGDSLQKAMFSFYNSGYKKAEIEEAARFLQSSHFSPERYLLQQQAKSQTSTSSKTAVKTATVQTITAQTIPQKTIATQPVKATPAYNPILPQGVSGGASDYQSRTQKKSVNSGLGSKWLVIALVFVLLGLMGAVAYIFFFKPELLAQIGIDLSK